MQIIFSWYLLLYILILSNQRGQKSIPHYFCGYYTKKEAICKLPMLQITLPFFQKKNTGVSFRCFSPIGVVSRGLVSPSDEPPVQDVTIKAVVITKSKATMRVHLSIRLFFINCTPFFGSMHHFSQNSTFLLYTIFKKISITYIKLFDRFMHYFNILQDVFTSWR